MAAQLVTIWWRDIPAQVNAQQGRNREKHVLADRFQVAIDRAAMVADITTTDAYVKEWRRTSVPLTGDPVEVAAAEAARLDAEYSPEVLDRLIRTGGISDSAQEASTTSTEEGSQ